MRNTGRGMQEAMGAVPDSAGRVGAPARSASSIRGFTIAEMMVVVGIIGMVVALSLPMLIPMMRTRKLETAADAVKSSCILARSKAIQQRRWMNVTLLAQTDGQHGPGVVITDYDSLRAAVGATVPYFCAHFLGNYGGNADTRFARLKAVSQSMGEKVRYLPEGCRFDLGLADPTAAWTYIFFPTGEAWALPANAENKRDLWFTTTCTIAGRPAGPMIYGPEDRDSTTVVVYAMTGQAVTQ